MLLLLCTIEPQAYYSEPFPDWSFTGRFLRLLFIADKQSAHIFSKRPLSVLDWFSFFITTEKRCL